MVIEFALEDQSKLADLAAATHRTESDVVAETMHWFLSAQQESYANAVSKGDDDFASGNFLEHDAAVASFADVLSHL